MFGLVAIAALMAMAVGAGSATAESTALCDIDPGTGSEEVCPSGHLVTHVHEATLSGNKAVLLNGYVDIECDVLFLGDTVASLGAPLLITGTFTYTNCQNFCTITEENGPATIEVLKLGHETAEVLVDSLIFMNCDPPFLECYYNGEALQGTAKGYLLSSESNGEISLQKQELVLDQWGFLCYESIALDIVIAPLTATFITK
jgi:hypothetical protein